MESKIFNQVVKQGSKSISFEGNFYSYEQMQRREGVKNLKRSGFMRKKD